MDGAAGSSGIDTAGWKRLCTSFGTLPIFVMPLLVSQREFVQPMWIRKAQSMQINHKCPGVKPIGVGETLRRIVGKAVSTTLKSDIQDVVGPVQLCANYEGGCEAAVHELFS